MDLGYDPPPAAAPTHDPNRYTLHVPTDRAVLSLGKASSAWINDTGITAKTDTHIHWHTADKPAPTMVLLGGPSTTAFEGYRDNACGSNTGSNHGFMAVTAGHAFIDAKEQFFVTAREKDLILRAVAEKFAVVQSDKGCAEVNAKESVTVHGGSGVAISASDFAPHTMNYMQELGREGQEHSPPVRRQASHEGSRRLAGRRRPDRWLYEDVAGSRKSGEKGFAAQPAWGQVKYIVDALKAIATVKRFLSRNDPGQVKISAASDASMAGGRAASIYGLQSASVTSLISATLIGMTAGVKGFAYASLFGGLDASVKAYGTASLVSDRGQVKVSSKSKTQVVSKDGSVQVTALGAAGDVQLNSNNGNAYVHGLQMAYLGAGPGAGFGLKVTDSELHLGQIHGGAAKFNKPSFKKKNKLFIQEDLMQLTIGDSSASLEPSTLTLKSKDIVLETDSASGRIEVTKSGIVKLAC